MALLSMQEILDRSHESGKPFWEIVLEDDMEERQVTRETSMAKMLSVWRFWRILLILPISVRFFVRRRHCKWMRC